MKTERIAELLRASSADAWEIIDSRIKGWEFYFIRHELDQNRAKDVEHVTIRVYKNIGEEAMGSASARIAVSETEENVKKTIDDLVYQASLVRNKPYRLNPPRDFEPMPEYSGSVEAEAEAFINAMNSVRETETEDINSFEIFTDSVERRLINSEGIDITEKYPSSKVEVVVNARKDGHEIELYRLYDLGSCDRDGLVRDVEEVLQIGKDKLIAVPTPAIGTSPVVFSTDAALEIYGYFLDNLNAAYAVRGMTSFELGKPMAEDIRGDKVTLNAVRYMEGSPSNFACDAEGSPIRDLCMIDAGVPKAWCGSRMFTQYMGLDDAFDISNWEVSGGSRSAAELRKGNFLEVVEFSDFQVDSMTGDIFGEIRLGYLHRDGNVIPVSGGSVSGSMRDNLPEMYMSKETRRYSSARVPAVTRLEKVTVSGISGEDQ